LSATDVNAQEDLTRYDGSLLPLPNFTIIRYTDIVIASTRQTSRPRREFVYPCSPLQGFTLVSPLEGFSHGAVEIINEFQDAVFQLIFTDEIGASE
jgi:hypothetical protein